MRHAGNLITLLAIALLLFVSCGAADPFGDVDDSDPYVYWMLHHYEWHPWEYDYFLRLVGSVQSASDLTGVAPESIVAVLVQESDLRHYKKDGSVKHGDGGRAIGIGQIHKSPWVKHFSTALDRDVDLYDLEDNVEVCARLLIRGGWEDSRIEAYGYYNTGQRGVVNGYARSVKRIEDDIYECK